MNIVGRRVLVRRITSTLCCCCSLVRNWANQVEKHSISVPCRGARCRRQSSPYRAALRHPRRAAGRNGRRKCRRGRLRPRPQRRRCAGLRCGSPARQARGGGGSRRRQARQRRRCGHQPVFVGHSRGCAVPAAGRPRGAAQPILWGGGHGRDRAHLQVCGLICLQNKVWGFNIHLLLICAHKLVWGRIGCMRSCSPTGKASLLSYLLA